LAHAEAQQRQAGFRAKQVAGLPRGKEGDDAELEQQRPRVAVAEVQGRLQLGRRPRRRRPACPAARRPDSQARALRVQQVLEQARRERRARCAAHAAEWGRKARAEENT
jgi:hypothetical protein